MFLDGQEIAGVYLGDTEISGAYVGDKEVFSKAPAGPLYAAYHVAGASDEQLWFYAKYPLDGSLLVYYSGAYENKVSSSSQLTSTFSALSITEELITFNSIFPSAYRDRSADLYT